MDRQRLRRYAAPVSFVAAGLAAGAILAGGVAANASDATPSTGSYAGAGSYSGAAGTQGDPSKPMRSDEQLLTGDTKAKVEAAALAKYPGATIERTETDSDGVYESHIVTADGQHLIVQVDKAFAVTGTDTRGSGGGKG